MPSFDIVSQVDMQEMENAINQAKKEYGNRYDFRGSKACIEWDKKQITIKAEDEYKMGALKDMLQSKVHRRGVNIEALDFSSIEQIGGMMLKQNVNIKQGIDRETAKKNHKES